jgi:tRNA G18 (ribose-2'-O)-methylase SpoU
MREIVVIAHNIRSTHNVGSLLRTADGLGVHTVYLTGYTPYPQKKADERLPHLARKIDSQIAKTALGAEKSSFWRQFDSVHSVINDLKSSGYTLVGLEQTQDSVLLPRFSPPDKIAVLLGSEVDGIEPNLLNLCDAVVEIPMYGQKESFNVVQASAICLYTLREA